MKLTPIIFLVIAISAAACSTNDPVNSNQTNRVSNSANLNAANAVKDDVDGLEMTIKLPFHPEEAVWREDAGGENPKKLTAVIRFLKADTEKIIAQAQNYQPAQPAALNTESWFPAELIAQSQTSGDESLKGQSYAANDFFNPPYTAGKVTRIEGTDYFVLELLAK